MVAVALLSLLFRWGCGSACTFPTTNTPQLSWKYFDRNMSSLLSFGLYGQAMARCLHCSPFQCTSDAKHTVLEGRRSITAQSTITLTITTPMIIVIMIITTTATLNNNSNNNKNNNNDNKDDSRSQDSARSMLPAREIRHGEKSTDVKRAQINEQWATT